MKLAAVDKHGGQAGRSLIIIVCMDEYLKAMVAIRDRLRSEIAESERGVLASGAPFETTPETLTIMRRALADLEVKIAAEIPNA